MKIYREKYSRSQLKRVLVILAGVLTLGTTFVLTNYDRSESSNLNLYLITDSLILKGPSFKKFNLMGGWIKLYEQKKWFETIRQRDSLQQKEIESLKEIDEELNDLINEKN